MVLQRRLNYGFNGYQVPVVPRGSRTTRGRGSIRKKVDDDQIRAFEILATVAGNFLQERENSASLNTAEIIDQHAINKYIDKRRWKDVGQTMKLKAYAPRSHDSDAFAFAATSQGGHQTKSQRESFANKVDIASSKNACGISSRKVVDTSSEYGKSFESINGRNLDVELLNIRSSTNGAVSDRNRSKNSMELDRKPASLASSDGCFRASVFKDRDILRPFSRCEGNIGVVSKDDDENSCGCFQRGTRMEAYRSLLQNGDQRIRKLLAAKHCRAASNLKQKGYFKTDGKMKPVYRNWKSCYVRQRSQRISSFKRRRFLGRRPVSSSDGGFICKGLFNSFEKGMIGGTSYAAREVSSSVAGQQETPLSGDCNVKLSIKSLRVPELLIEIPVNSTVGSLKRAVMEAVTAVLGDRLHVGMLLQGKKVKDDSKTLHQTGISQGSKLHSLGFMLERKNEKDLPLPPGGTPLWLSRYSAPSISEPGTSNDSAALPAENLSNCLENGLDTFPHIFGVSNEKTIAESKALVAEKAMGVEVLAVVPIRNQSKRPEFGQRRIRRPFSVSEVEALVQAVEKIGTGRWRDVKLCAFDGAKHRTYVDLKDKWKTLVHTAKLLPQQRRGEPVPQDLLDRVMAAHAYWCQEQAKLQV